MSTSWGPRNQSNLINRLWWSLVRSKNEKWYIKTDAAGRTNIEEIPGVRLLWCGGR